MAIGTGYDYTCAEVDNFFIAETGRFGPSMLQKRAALGPWYAGTPKGTWVDGMGVIHNSIYFERTVPTDDGDEWLDQTFSDSSGDPAVDACSLDPEEINFGQTTRSFRVARRNIQTNFFCVEDLRNDFAISNVLGQVMTNLEFVTGYAWETRFRREFIRLAEHKITENEEGDFDISATSFDPTSPPTSRLTWGTLERIYDWLKANGAAIDGAIGTGRGGRPIFDLYSDDNTFRALQRDNPDLREDLRWAFAGKGMDSPLLMMRGDMEAWNGYRFVTDSYPYRYEIIGGVETQVQPFSDPTSTSKGVKQELRKEYMYATYQKTVIHIPTVFKALMLKPITSPGGEFKFDPVNWVGQFSWLNIRDYKCNPHGLKGKFDALFASASEPGHTWHGFVVAHLNCAPPRYMKRSCYS